MMRRKVNPNEAPPGFWRYPVGDKIIGPFPARIELINAVRKHYSANGELAPANLEAAIDEWICARIHPSLCEDSETHTSLLVEPRSKTAVLPFNAVVQGTMTIGEWFIAGRLLHRMKLAPREEANGRGRVCLSCPHNVAISKCAACVAGRMEKAIQRIVGSDRTDMDAKLQGCNLCGCSLKVKVWMPIALLRKHMSEEHLKQFPPHCWLVTEPTEEKAT